MSYFVLCTNDILTYLSQAKRQKEFDSRETSRTRFHALAHIQASQSGRRRRAVGDQSPTGDTAEDPPRTGSVVIRTITTITTVRIQRKRLPARGTTTVVTNNPHRRTSTWSKGTRTPTRFVPPAPPVLLVVMNCMICHRGGTTAECVLTMCLMMLWPLPGSSSRRE